MENMLFSLSDIILIGGFALETGIVLQRLKVIEKKQDIHNGLIEKHTISKERLKFWTKSKEFQTTGLTIWKSI